MKTWDHVIRPLDFKPRPTCIKCPSISQYCVEYKTNTKHGLMEVQSVVCEKHAEEFARKFNLPWISLSKKRKGAKMLHVD